MRGLMCILLIWMFVRGCILFFVDLGAVLSLDGVLLKLVLLYHDLVLPFVPEWMVVDLSTSFDCDVVDCDALRSA